MTYLFPCFEPVHYSMSYSNCCFLTSIHDFKEAGKWSGILISLRIFPQFVVVQIAKSFWVVNETEVDAFLNSLSFSMIQWISMYLIQGVELDMEQ